MPKYELKDVPQDLWNRFTERARFERWPTRSLLLQLMEDYASNRIEPSIPPPMQRPEYAWIRPLFRHLATQPAFVAMTDADRWWKLLEYVETNQPATYAELKAVPPEHRGELMRWLGDTALSDLRSAANPLTLRAVSHIGWGEDMQAGRRAVQYEAIGLPRGQDALIVESKRGWRIMRYINGQPVDEGSELHVSAQAARDYLESIIEKERSAP